MGMRQWLSDPRNNRAVTIGLFFVLCTLPALAPGLFPLALQVNPWTQAVFDHIETLEAGDVMMAGRHFYIGISDRTNHQGADQMIHILERYRMTGEKIEINQLLHLKSGMSYLEDNNLLVQNGSLNHPAFYKFRKIKTGADEDYAANSLWVNGTVLVPAGFPITRNNIEQAGYPTITLDVSEFEKLDGGLSCLSLRF